MKLIIVLFLLVSFSFGQMLKKNGFFLSSVEIEQGDSEVLLGNGVIDLLEMRDSILVAGTGYGLNLTADNW